MERTKEHKLIEEQSKDYLRRKMEPGLGSQTEKSREFPLLDKPLKHVVYKDADTVLIDTEDMFISFSYSRASENFLPENHSDRSSYKSKDWRRLDQLSLQDKITGNEIHLENIIPHDCLIIFSPYRKGTQLTLHREDIGIMIEGNMASLSTTFKLFHEIGHIKLNSSLFDSEKQILNNLHDPLREKNTVELALQLWKERMAWSYALKDLHPLLYGKSPAFMREVKEFIHSFLRTYSDEIKIDLFFNKNIPTDSDKVLQLQKEAILRCQIVQEFRHLIDTQLHILEELTRNSPPECDK